MTSNGTKKGNIGF